ncbi:MAG: hypothetical protein AB9888_13125 [Bacteroidales bacterium]
MQKRILLKCVLLSMVLIIIFSVVDTVKADYDRVKQIPYLQIEPVLSDQPKSIRPDEIPTDDGTKVPWVDKIQQFFEEKMTDSLIGLLRGACSIIWFFTKLIGSAFLAIYNYDSGSFWNTTIDLIFKSLTDLMPGVLQKAFMGIDGGGGIALLAISLAGFLMTIPLLSARNLVKADQAILWGVVISALFISGTFGYDFITGVEKLRRALLILPFGATNGEELVKVIAAPMMASVGEVKPDYNQGQLPTAFDSKYFPKAEKKEYTLLFGDMEGLKASGVPVLWDGVMGKIKVETVESMKKRTIAANGAVISAVISLISTPILITMALFLILIDLSAIILIIFFLAALPLGFFEFGRPILLNLTKQYIYICALTLFAGVFAALVQAIQGNLIIEGVASLQRNFTGLILNFIFSFGFWKAINMAWSAVGGTFTIAQNSFAMIRGEAPAGGVGTGDMEQSVRDTSNAFGKASGDEAVGNKMRLAGGGSLGVLSGNMVYGVRGAVESGYARAAGERLGILPPSEDGRKNKGKKQQRNSNVYQESSIFDEYENATINSGRSVDRTNRPVSPMQTSGGGGMLYSRDDTQQIERPGSNIDLVVRNDIRQALNSQPESESQPLKREEEVEMPRAQGAQDMVLPLAGIAAVSGIEGHSPSTQDESGALAQSLGEFNQSVIQLSALIEQLTASLQPAVRPQTVVEPANLITEEVEKESHPAHETDVKAQEQSGLERSAPRQDTQNVSEIHAVRVVEMPEEEQKVDVSNLGQTQVLAEESGTPATPVTDEEPNFKTEPRQEQQTANETQAVRVVEMPEEGQKVDVSNLTPAMPGGQSSGIIEEKAAMPQEEPAASEPQIMQVKEEDGNNGRDKQSVDNKDGDHQIKSVLEVEEPDEAPSRTTPQIDTSAAAATLSALKSENMQSGIPDQLLSPSQNSPFVGMGNTSGIPDENIGLNDEYTISSQFAQNGMDKQTRQAEDKAGEPATTTKKQEEVEPVGEAEKGNLPGTKAQEESVLTKEMPKEESESDDQPVEEDTAITPEGSSLSEPDKGPEHEQGESKEQEGLVEIITGEETLGGEDATEDSVTVNKEPMDEDHGHDEQDGLERAGQGDNGAIVSHEEESSASAEPTEKETLEAPESQEQEESTQNVSEASYESDNENDNVALAENEQIEKEEQEKYEKAQAERKAEEQKLHDEMIKELTDDELNESKDESSGRRTGRKRGGGVPFKLDR